jgi:dsRNA-specific ribonuclease
VEDRQFTTPPGYATKQAARSDAAKLAVIGLGILRASPQLLQVRKYLRQGDRVRLRGEPRPSVALPHGALPSSLPANTTQSDDYVSVLQIKCTQRSWNPPEYDLEQAAGASHTPRFGCKLRILNLLEVEVPAEFASKKLAKQAAAKCALQQLEGQLNNGVPDPAPVSTEQVSTEEHPNTVLHQMAQQLKIRGPIFEYLEVKLDQGVLPHWKAYCDISSFRLHGLEKVVSKSAHPSKDAAKKDAANEALQKLRAFKG